MAYIVVAYKVMAYMLMAYIHRYGLYSYGLHSYGLYSYGEAGLPGPYSYFLYSYGLSDMAHIVMAYIDVAYVDMAHTVMAYIDVAYVDMAHIVMAYIVMAKQDFLAPCDPQAIFLRGAAFTSDDVGKTVSVPTARRDSVEVGGQARGVLWGGPVTKPDGKVEGTIKAVEDWVTGAVKLDGGKEFQNPFLQADVQACTYKYRALTNTARLQVPRAYKYCAPTNPARRFWNSLRPTLHGWFTSGPLLSQVAVIM